MAQKVKLSTIAETLGLSTATISLALRDSPLVAADTREKIKEQARVLGYIYNRRAASLRTSRSGIIGVVVHDIMNPFYGEIPRPSRPSSTVAGTPSFSPTIMTASTSSGCSSKPCCSSAATG